MTADKPRIPFPLIRHLSGPVTRILAMTPLSANMITVSSLLLGLGAAWVLFALPMAESRLPAAGLFLGAYILDNCDGEIARLKGQSSTFGMHFDTFVDWVVHAAFFAALGIGVAAATGTAWWGWLGWLAAFGSTANYFVGLYLDHLRPTSDEPVVAEAPALPQTRMEWVLYAFRELSRADFCFIVLALAFFDALWLLLPAGAIGAQVYWLAQFCAASRRFNA